MPRYSAPLRKDPKESVRTCVGCRRTDARSALKRVALSMSAEETAQLVWDTQAKMPGRGAWVHADSSCHQKALNSGAFYRSFRNKQLDLSQLSN